MAISHCYCCSLYRQINWQIYPLVLTSSGQEWQFHIATVTAHIGRSTGRSTPYQSSTDALSTITPNLVDLLADLPPSIEHRCLEYHYTKLGKSMGRSTQSIEHRCLEYHYTKLGRSTGRSTQSLEHRCLEYHYTKLGKSTGRSTQSIKHRCLEYHYTKLGKSTGRSTPLNWA